MSTIWDGDSVWSGRNPDDPARLTDPSSPLDGGGPRSSFLGTALAWTVILIMVLAMTVRANWPDPPAEPGNGDPIGVRMMEIQARFIVGQAAMDGAAGSMLLQSNQVRMLNTGTVPQRLRFVALASELGGPRAGLDALVELETRIQAHNALVGGDADRRPVELSEAETRTAALLQVLFTGYVAEDWAGSQLDADDRLVLLQELGWFGELALAPRQSPDVAAREAALAPAQRSFWALVVVAVLGIGAGGLGLVGLILIIVFACIGLVKGGVGGRLPHGGIYAETFAVWLIVFFGLNVGLGLIPVPDQNALAVSVLCFFASLIALSWPLLRGIPWSQLRADIGWTWPRAGVLEPAVGVGCYGMGLPILGVGIALTFVCLMIQGAFAGSDPAESFGPSGGPAHPIVGMAGSGSIWIAVQLYLLASVAAPIVEETMFRGVLYRHLRSASASSGAFLSVFISALLNSVLFAAIHPQGWVAIPALSSLAISMTLAREWRQSLVSSMVFHGVSNGVITTLLLILISG